MENHLLEETLYHSLAQQFLEAVVLPQAAPSYALRSWKESETRWAPLGFRELLLNSDSAHALVHVPLAWSRTMLSWWFMQGPGGDCHSSFLSCALRFPSLGKEMPAEANVIEWWWHIWPRQAGDLGIDPSLDTNPGILCYFFPPCQFVEAPTQLENTESNEKCTRRPAETTRPLKVFGILS